MCLGFRVWIFFQFLFLQWDYERGPGDDCSQRKVSRLLRRNNGTATRKRGRMKGSVRHQDELRRNLSKAWKKRIHSWKHLYKQKTVNESRAPSAPAALKAKSPDWVNVVTLFRKNKVVSGRPWKFGLKLNWIIYVYQCIFWFVLCSVFCIFAHFFQPVSKELSIGNVQESKPAASQSNSSGVTSLFAFAEYFLC